MTQPRSTDEISADAESLPLRPANQVMQLERLGSYHQFRLSFMRTLIRRMMREQWKIDAVVFDLDKSGYGTVVYEIQAKYGLYSFVLFSNYLDPENRSDRVIASQWDLTMALCEGKVDAQQLEFLRSNVPKQEAGRVDSRVFVLSRANKSSRNFDYVVSELAQGWQPDVEQIAKVGYLYRTTAVYGSGKFGMADWEKVKTKYPDFARPFAAEMFTCYMLRHFSLEQADYLARQRAPETAVVMDDGIKRYFGIGNATGLGMAPFLIHHPQLINQWIEVRETALSRAIYQGAVTEQDLNKLQLFADRVIQHLGEIITGDQRQNESNALVRAEMQALKLWLYQHGATTQSWRELTQHAEQAWRTETQEVINTLLIELYPELVDCLEDKMAVTQQHDLIPEMTLQALKDAIETKYDWALTIDFDQEAAQQVFWYRSEEKMEPRLGERAVDPGQEKEMPLAIGRSVRDCYDALCSQLLTNPHDDVAHFLLRQPQHKGTIRRIQTMAQSQYGEIRENLVHRDVLPIHLLRCKLSFFGVSKFDPRSRLWVRNTMFQGAPLISDIGKPFSDDWHFPIKPWANESPAVAQQR
ncbi:MAG: hypothetical protein ACR2P1_28720 [Pseudomonadales bacterium]